MGIYRFDTYLRDKGKKNITEKKYWPPTKPLPFLTAELLSVTCGNTSSSSSAASSPSPSSSSDVNVVIDGLNITTWICSLANPATNEILAPAIFGGDFSRFTEYMKSFVEVFKSHKIHLILVFRGYPWKNLIADGKLRRSDYQGRNMDDIYSMIADYVDEGTIPLEAIRPLGQFYQDALLSSGDEEEWKRMELSDTSKEATNTTTSSESNGKDLESSLGRTRFDVVSNRFSNLVRLLQNTLYQHVVKVFSDQGMDVIRVDGNDDAIISQIAKQRQPCLGVWSYDSDFKFMEGIQAIDSKSARDDGLIEQIDKHLQCVRTGIDLKDPKYRLPCGCVRPNGDGHPNRECLISLRIFSPPILSKIMEIPIRLLPDLAILCGTDMTRLYLNDLYKYCSLIEASVPDTKGNMNEALEFLQKEFCCCPVKDVGAASSGRFPISAGPNGGNSTTASNLVSILDAEESYWNIDELYDLPYDILMSEAKCKHCKRPFHFEHHDGFAPLFEKEKTFLLGNDPNQNEIAETLNPRYAFQSFIYQVIGSRYFYAQQNPTPFRLLGMLNVFLFSNAGKDPDRLALYTEKMEALQFGLLSLPENMSPLVSQSSVDTHMYRFSYMQRTVANHLNDSRTVSFLAGSLLNLIDRTSLMVLAKRIVVSDPVFEFIDTNPRSLSTSLLLRSFRSILLGLLTSGQHRIPENSTTTLSSTVSVDDDPNSLKYFRSTLSFQPFQLPRAGEPVNVFNLCSIDSDEVIYVPLYPSVSTTCSNEATTMMDPTGNGLITDLLLIKLRGWDVDKRIRYMIEAFHESLIHFNEHWFCANNDSSALREKYRYDPSSLRISPWLRDVAVDYTNGWPFNKLFTNSSVPSISVTYEPLSDVTKRISHPSATLAVMFFRHLLAVISNCTMSTNTVAPMTVSSLASIPTLNEISTLVAGISCLLYLYSNEPNESTKTKQHELRNLLISYDSLSFVPRPQSRAICLTTWYRETVTEMMNLLANVGLMNNFGYQSVATQYSNNELMKILYHLCNGSPEYLPPRWRNNSSILHQNIIGDARTGTETSPFGNVTWEHLYEGRLFHFLFSTLDGSGYLASADSSTVSLAEDNETQQDNTNTTNVADLLGGTDEFSWLSRITQNMLNLYPDVKDIYNDMMQAILMPFDTTKIHIGFSVIRKLVNGNSKFSISKSFTENVLTLMNLQAKSNKDDESVSCTEGNEDTNTTAAAQASEISMVSPFLARCQVYSSSISSMNPPDTLKKRIDGERNDLPIYSNHDEALVAISTCLVTAIIASTGTGKTTQLPQYLLHQNNWVQALVNNGWQNPSKISSDGKSYKGISPFIWGDTEKCRIYTTQPEVLFATKAAIRIASEVYVRTATSAKADTKISSISYSNDDMKGYDIFGGLVGVIVGGSHKADREGCRTKIVSVTAGWLYAKLLNTEIPQENYGAANESNVAVISAPTFLGQPEKLMDYLQIKGSSNTWPDPSNPLATLGVTHLLIDEVHERKMDNEALCLLVRDLLYRDLQSRFYRIGAKIQAYFTETQQHDYMGRLSSKDSKKSRLNLIAEIFQVFANRPRLIVMSATFDAQQIGDYFMESIRNLVESFICWLLFSTCSNYEEGDTILRKMKVGKTIGESNRYYSLSFLAGHGNHDTVPFTDYKELWATFLPLLPEQSNWDGDTTVKDFLRELLETKVIDLDMYRGSTADSDRDSETSSSSDGSADGSILAVFPTSYTTLPINKKTFLDLLFGYLSNHSVQLKSSYEEHPQEIYLDTILHEVYLNNPTTAHESFMPTAYSRAITNVLLSNGYDTKEEFSKEEKFDIVCTQLRGMRERGIRLPNSQLQKYMEYMDKGVNNAILNRPYRRPISERDMETILKLACYLAVSRCNPTQIRQNTSINRSDAVLVFVSGASDIHMAQTNLDDIIFHMNCAGHQFHLYSADTVLEKKDLALPSNWNKLKMSLSETLRNPHVRSNIHDRSEGYSNISQDSQEEEEEDDDDNESMEEGDSNQQVAELITQFGGKIVDYMNQQNGTGNRDETLKATETHEVRPEVRPEVREKLRNTKKIIFVRLHSSSEAYRRFEELEQIRLQPNGYYSNATLIAFSTPVAESSITIPGLHTVIDLGFHKEIDIVEEHDSKTLVRGWISQAAARQRMGRAGRTPAPFFTPHTVFRLYTKAFHDYCFRQHNKSGMQREIGMSAVLKMKKFANLSRYLRLYNTPEQQKFLDKLRASEGSVPPLKRFTSAPADCQYSSISAHSVFNRALDPPNDTLVDISTFQLYQLGMLTTPNDNTAEITKLGELINRIPVDPVSAMIIIVGRVFNCLPDAIVMAAYNAVASSGQTFWSYIGTKRRKASQTGWSTSDIIDNHYRTLTGFTLLGKEYFGNENPSANYVWSDHIIALRAYILWRSQRTLYGFNREKITGANKLVSRFNIDANFLRLMEERIINMTNGLLHDRRIGPLLTETERDQLNFLLAHDEMAWRRHYSQEKDRSNDQRNGQVYGRYNNNNRNSSYNGFNTRSGSSSDNWRENPNTTSNNSPSRYGRPPNNGNAFSSFSRSSYSNGTESTNTSTGVSSLPNRIWPPKSLFCKNANRLRMVLFAASYNTLTEGKIHCNTNLRNFMKTVSVPPKQYPDCSIGEVLTGSKPFHSIVPLPLLPRNMVICDLRFTPLTWSLHPSKVSSQKAVSALQQLFCPRERLEQGNDCRICSAICGKGINSIMDEEIKLYPVIGFDNQKFGGIAGLLQIRNDYSDIIDNTKHGFWKVVDDAAAAQVPSIPKYDRIADSYDIRWTNSLVYFTLECAELLKFKIVPPSREALQNAFANVIGNLPPLLLSAFLYEGRAPHFSMKVGYSENKRAAIEHTKRSIASVSGGSTASTTGLSTKKNDKNTDVISTSLIDNIFGSQQAAEAYFSHVKERHDQRIPALQNDTINDTEDVPIPLSYPYYLTWLTNVPRMVPKFQYFDDDDDVDDGGNDDEVTNTGDLNTKEEYFDPYINLDSRNRNYYSSSLHIDPKRSHEIYEYNQNLALQRRIDRRVNYGSSVRSTTNSRNSSSGTDSSSSSSNRSIHSSASSFSPFTDPSIDIELRTVRTSPTERIFQIITPLNDEQDSDKVYGISTRVSLNTFVSDNNVEVHRTRLGGFSLVSRDINEVVLMMRIFRLNTPLRSRYGLHTSFMDGNGIDPETQVLTEDDILLTYKYRNTTDAMITQVIFDYGSVNESPYTGLAITENRWREATDIHEAYCDAIKEMTEVPNGTATSTTSTARNTNAGNASYARRNGNSTQSDQLWKRINDVVYKK